MLDNKLKHQLRGYSWIVVSLISVVFLFIGCGSSNNGSSNYAQAFIGNKAYTEDEFFKDDTLSIIPQDSIALVFLEPDSDTEEINDSFVRGIDVVPYAYPQIICHTFCWADNNSTAAHYMILQDLDGTEILRVTANNDCVTEVIKAGNYNALFYHDNKTDATFPIFVVPFPAEYPFSDVALTTIIQTNNCQNCDLSYIDLSYRNLNNVDLTNSILKNVILKGTSFVNATLRNVNFYDAAIYPSTDFTGADISGANFTGSYFTPQLYDQKAEQHELPAKNDEITEATRLAATRKWNYVVRCNYTQQNPTLNIQLILNIYDSIVDSAAPLGKFSITVKNDESYQTETFQRLAGSILASKLEISLEQISNGDTIEPEILERSDDVLKIRYQAPGDPDSYVTPDRHIKITDFDILYVHKMVVGMKWEFVSGINSGISESKFNELIFPIIDYAEPFRIEEINPTQDSIKSLNDHLYSYFATLYENNDTLSSKREVSYRYEIFPSGPEIYLPVSLAPPHILDPIGHSEKLSTSIKKWWFDNKPPQGSFIIHTTIFFDPVSGIPLLSLRNVTLESEHISDLN